uniref:Uncharacterized protein n=1 Tax=Timema tahoe TaxID=61484 RepID=A0A7R9IKM0_9NEOP|nr:unnamed protein product [Timema tahoe]
MITTVTVNEEARAGYIRRIPEALLDSLLGHIWRNRVGSLSRACPEEEATPKEAYLVAVSALYFVVLIRDHVTVSSEVIRATRCSVRLSLDSQEVDPSDTQEDEPDFYDEAPLPG